MDIQYLYRYRSGCEYDMENLSENKIWFTNPMHFNDPYDCAIQLGINALTERMMYFKMLELYGDKITTDQIKKLSHLEFNASLFLQEDAEKEPINEDLHKMISHVGVACFSLKNNSIPMWGYYSNSHSGFCIEYKLEDLKKFGMVNKVVYCDKFEPLYNDLITKASYNKFINTYICLKASAWQHEEEVRIVIGCTEILSEKKGILMDSPIPSAIYLGSKIPKEKKEQLILIARKRGINIFQMKIKKSGFELFSIEVE